MASIILGISGASGVSLAFKALDLLTSLEETVELIMTKDASLTALEELGSNYQSPQKMVACLGEKQRDKVRCWKNNDFYAPFASGSCRVKGMLLLPCSMATIAAVAMGLSDTLLRRAADVSLKEKRTLVVAPREAPLHQMHLENMAKLSQLGAVIHPPVPAWYAHPKTLDDMETYLVHRMLDHFNLPQHNYQRWKE